MYNFIHVPKAAGDSFNELIEGRRGQIAYAGHIRVTDIKTVAIVRNPYDRLVSAYFYLIKGGGQNQMDLSFCEILKKYVDFRDFVLNIADDKLIDQILHSKPMYYFLCNDDNEIVVDVIFKIEDVGAIDDFLAGLGIEKKLSETTRNTSVHNHYSAYLDSEVVAEINQIYDLDFKLFNYEKIIP